VKIARLLVLALPLLILGCATPPVPPPAAPPVSDIWPKIYDDESYLTDFGSSWSEDEAVGVIRNLQNSMVDNKADMALSELSVDPYGMRARWSWVEVGNIQKSAGFVIPFDQVTSVLLEHYPKTDKAYKWGINAYISGTSPVSVRTPTRDAAERLGKALVVLAKARKAPLGLPNMRFGAALGTLSPDQAQAAGILQSAGIIVSWIFKESPAERAGFSPQDIITKVGGKTVQKGQELFDLVEAAAKEGAKEIGIDGLRRSYRVEGEKYIEIFVPVRFTLPIVQGGSK